MDTMNFLTLAVSCHDIFYIPSSMMTVLTAGGRSSSQDNSRNLTVQVIGNMYNME
jgi:hypothetical protein